MPDKGVINLFGFHNIIFIYIKRKSASLASEKVVEPLCMADLWVAQAAADMSLGEGQHEVRGEAGNPQQQDHDPMVTVCVVLNVLCCFPSFPLLIVENLWRLRQGRVHLAPSSDSVPAPVQACCSARVTIHNASDCQLHPCLGGWPYVHVK